MGVTPEVVTWLDPQTYYQRAMALRVKGESAAGHFGATCEDCHLEIPIMRTRSKKYCQCKPQKMLDMAEVMRAHGLDHLIAVVTYGDRQKIG